MSAAWYRFDPDRNVLCIKVHVQPNARTTEVSGLHGDALKVRLAAPPLEGRANALLIDFLEEKLGVPASRISIARGQKSRAKLVEVSGVSDAALQVIRDWERR
jgi:uncharacterized protein (TIGR00251 family)